MEKEVKLIGTWLSPYSYRVVWALKLKGISYEYIGENLSNKSALLLQYNPIHKKIPVLVHGGKPICESMIILQYIDETWPHNPLLPSDPYERAKARFLIQFIEDKAPTLWSIYRTKGKEQERAVKESLEILQTIEENILGDNKFFMGDDISMVDIAYGGVAHWLDPMEQVTGAKVFEPDKFPRLRSWIKNFKEVPVIRDSLPDLEKMVAVLRHLREKVVGTAGSRL